MTEQEWRELLATLTVEELRKVAELIFTLERKGDAAGMQELAQS